MAAPTACWSMGVRLLDHQAAGYFLAVAGEDHGVDAGGQLAGVDAEDNAAGSLQMAGMQGASHVVDEGHGVVAAVAQVDLDVGTGGGGVGIELAEQLLSRDHVDACRSAAVAAIVGFFVAAEFVSEIAQVASGQGKRQRRD